MGGFEYDQAAECRQWDAVYILRACMLIPPNPHRPYLITYVPTIQPFVCRHYALKPTYTTPTDEAEDAYVLMPGVTGVTMFRGSDDYTHRPPEQDHGQL